MTEYFTGQELLNRYTAENQLSMVKRAAWNLLRPFVPGESSIGTRLYEKTRLDSFA